MGVQEARGVSHSIIFLLYLLLYNRYMTNEQQADDTSNALRSQEFTFGWSIHLAEVKLGIN